MRRSAVALLLALCAVAIVAWVAAGKAVSVPRWPVGAKPVDLPVEDLAVEGEPGIVIRGWSIANDCRCGVVVLLHGSAGQRESMMPRARFLYRAGYSVVTVDMRAHGQSGGEFTTFGGRESRDVRAVIAETRRRFAGQKLGAIGFSLGGAALLLGARPAEVDAVVVEAVYATIEDTAGHRLRVAMGATLAEVLPWVLYAQMSWRFGVSRGELRPIERIAALRAPVLVMGGVDDPFTPPDETRRLYAAAPEPKELWIVPGAHHWDLHLLAAADYEVRVLRFLDRHLRQRH
ncbi:MAG TPA: alpha/beta fold hydrolase [Vineibacter sp.]|nr:alpha/beta fold hydrolase [Vineibacter sp.]